MVAIAYATVQVVELSYMAALNVLGASIIGLEIGFIRLGTEKMLTKVRSE